MDPSIVGSPQFGQLYRTLLPGTFSSNGQNVPEQIFSQPLVYTGTDGIQYVYIATTQNNVYKMNAKTGVIVASRNLHRPFLVSDLDGCTDINPTIGITATGVIDPATDTWYLTAKSYVDQNMNGPRGKPNGRYYVHAINTNDLSERANFPVDLEGTVSRNNANRAFGAGIHHQRPGLLQHGQFIYAGFASHCAQYNFTGWIFGWDRTTGKLVERFSSEGAGVAASVPGAGVWMSGGGLTSDDKGSMFFATGNGYASQLSNIPVNGRNPPTALEEAAVHMAINDDGSLRVVDFFMPWEKPQLDGADKDLGTTPLELLPSEFSCGNIKRIGIVTGKSGKTYWIDMDNMGGYQNGPGQLDSVIQVYPNENSVYAGAGVYPLEGGFIYISVIQYPTHVFKFSCSNGVPSFDKVADSPENNAYVLGVGHGTTTSLDGRAGTGLLWTSDVEGANLRIYDAVPVDGKLRLRKSFVTPGVTKFSRPVFGDGIVYQVTTLGYIYAYGSPVNLPLNCTSPSFGTVNINSTSAPVAVQCKANTALTVTAASLAGNPNFVISDLPSLPFQVAQGQSFSFRASFVPQSVGPLSSAIVLNTTQQAQGFSTRSQIQLQGTGQSQVPLLQVAPNTVSFNGFITGQDRTGVNLSATITNAGNSPLQLTSIQFSTVGETGPWITPNGSQDARSVSAFTFYSLPVTVAARSGVSVPINFNPSRSGSYAVFVKIVSNGGTKLLNVLATGNDQPKAIIEFETPDGGWIPFSSNTSFSFGNVTENTSRYLRLRVSNKGSGNSAALSLTVSKPPFGIPGSVIGASNQVDLGEGTLINSGQNATATLYCSVPKSQINVDSYNGTAVWTMNMNDPSFGKQQLHFFCNAVSEQSGPLNSATQQATYRYAGCFKENDPGRQLQTQIYSSDSGNTNDMCIAQCAAQGFIFAATQYRSQCWCGYNRPRTLVDETNCNFACTGNTNGICGGNGINGDGAFLSTFGDINRWNGNSTDAPGPYVNPGALGFRSLGCYTEATNARALSIVPSSNNTVLGCLNACKGYAYSGVEYGGQCFCGQSLAAGSVSAPSKDCSMSCNGNQTEFCGGPDRLNMYTTIPSGNVTSSTTSATAPASTSTTGPTSTASATGPPIPVATAGGFAYIDCYAEPPNSRGLVDKAYAVNRGMSADICATFCAGFNYMGMEYSSECYCGNILQPGSLKANDGRCSMTCSGNKATICGGPNGLSLYRYAPANTTTGTTTSTTIRSTSTFTATTTRSSTANQSFSSLNVTTSTLSSTPRTLNATTLPPLTGSTLLSTSLMTNTTFTTRLSSSVSSTSTSLSATIASSTGTTSLRSSASVNTTAVTISTFRSSSIASTAAANMTTPQATSNTSTVPPISSILATSSSSSSRGATSNMTTSSPVISRSLSPTSSIGSSPSSSHTSTSATPSTSRSTSSSLTVSTSTSLSTSSIRSSASSTTSSSAAASTTPAPYQPLGCYAEATNGRLLSGASSSTNTMSTSSCATFCLSKSLPVFGLEYGRECYCASSLAASARPLSPNTSDASSGCNMPCSGAATEVCGGNSRLSVYNNTLYSPPVHKATISGYAFQGCYTDIGPRTLQGYSFSNGNMSQELCVSTCAAKDFKVAGAEYAEQCFCGTEVLISADGKGGMKVQNGECAMPCKGDGSEWCGAGNRLSIWAM